MYSHSWKMAAFLGLAAKGGKRWRLRSLVLLVSALDVAGALVAVPERRPVATLVQAPLQGAAARPLVYFENSPLIGGPAWLPIHVKVVLDEGDFVHKWDFVPIDATNATTLLSLASLQPVPAEVRYQRRQLPLRLKQSNAAFAGYDIVLRSSIDESGADSGKENDLERHRRITERMLAKAELFCASYERDLHLLKNNCWTFALQLWYHLGNVEEL
jgi:hypothetical protein